MKQKEGWKEGGMEAHRSEAESAAVRPSRLESWCQYIHTELDRLFILSELHM